jgi:hypothetical protein
VSSPDRRTLAKDLAANIAVAGMLSAGAAVTCAATAAADPPPPPPGPEVPAPPPAPNPSDLLTNTLDTPLGQITGPVGPGGLPLFAGSDASPSNLDLLLSQHQIPAVQGTQPAAPPDTRFTDSAAYLFPHNFKLPDQGLTSMYSVAPPDPDAQNPGLIDYLRGAHGLWHTGMGRMEQDQLGQPLPGTAPPPGTNIPAGPEQFYEPPPPPGTPPAPPPGG